jgi:hypothetical protein
MTRVFTWKVLGVAVGVVLAAGLICLASGSTGMASALFVVAALEGAFGAIVIALVRSRQKASHQTVL